MPFDPRIYKLIQAKLYIIHELNSKSISFLTEFNETITQFMKELSELIDEKNQIIKPKNGVNHVNDSPSTHETERTGNTP